ncbi:MAG: single-stranded DNA-binding protein [Verrucomicrobia bacterium]|nr:single-stranded DNA-binding protein [Verrucomicrobiota bacterium]
MPANPKATLETLLHKLGFADATVAEQPFDDELTLNLTCAGSDRLIGRAGQTLRDLQYLTNRMLLQADADAPKVVVDVGGYRARQRDELIQKAQAAAEKVRRWGDTVELEPLNAYDRRIVHHALRGDPDIETHSIEVEGTDKKAILLRLKH